ncbi:MAG: protein-tyrosine phosphatase family protein [Rhizomicrobium sp.]
MPKILITSLAALPDAMAQHGPSHIVSLLSSGYMIETPRDFAADRHLRLAMHDIADEGMPESPSSVHIERLIDFGREWNASAPMIVHCWAGISRSTAAAYTLLCDRAGPGHELDIARTLRMRAPHAQPNKLLVKFATKLWAETARWCMP